MTHEYPHFLIVGFMKSATSTMYNTITQHPLVVRAKEKEIHYFSRDYTAADDRFWGFEYRDLLNYEEGSGNIYGEASPSYAHIKAARRIHRFNPRCKIIIMLREPVERMISQHAHHRRYGIEDLNIEDVMSSDQCTKYVLGSVYGHIIQEYADLFGKSQVLIISMEYFVNNMQITMDKVFNFLEIDPIQVSAMHSNKGDDISVDPELRDSIKRKIMDYKAPIPVDVIRSCQLATIPEDISFFENY